MRGGNNVGCGNLLDVSTKKKKKKWGGVGGVGVGG